MSEKARAAHQQASQRKYVETQRATAPPRSTYTRADGKTATINTKSPVANTIRSQPSTYHTPQARQQRTEVHIHNHGYNHPMNWYYSQPPMYLGGGYSPFLWYMMMEWSAERRAAWLYNNRDNIERDAYERGMRDAEVAKTVAELETNKVARDPNYVDPEFAKDPSLMYDQNYVEAVYNPTVVSKDNSGSGIVTFMVVMVIILVIAVIVYFMVFKVRWGE